MKTGMGGVGTHILMGLYEEPSLNLNLSEFMFRAGKIVAAWGIRDRRNENVRDAIHLMAEEKMNIMEWITHKMPEDKAVEAMEMLINKDDSAIGVEIIH